VIPPIATYVIVAWSVRLVHPDKAVGRNEMPFGRDTHVVIVVQSNIVWDRGPGPPTGRWDFGGPNPLVRSDTAWCQIAMALVIVTILINIVI